MHHCLSSLSKKNNVYSLCNFISFDTSFFHRLNLQSCSSNFHMPQTFLAASIFNFLCFTILEQQLFYNSATRKTRRLNCSIIFFSIMSSFSTLFLSLVHALTHALSLSLSHTHTHSRTQARTRSCLKLKREDEII